MWDLDIKFRKNSVEIRCNQCGANVKMSATDVPQNPPIISITTTKNICLHIVRFVEAVIKGSLTLTSCVKDYEYDKILKPLVEMYERQTGEKVYF